MNIIILTSTPNKPSIKLALDALEGHTVDVKTEYNRELKCDLLISIGGPVIPKEAFPLPCKGINLHTAPLPQYRGASTDSWMILNGEDGGLSFGCAHWLTPRIDAGNIILKLNYTMPHGAYPEDIYNTRIRIIPELLRQSIERLNSPGAPQDETMARYFPRLDTDRDGMIDWSWSAHEIERFVRAFGRPYSGAWTVFLGKKVRVLEGEVFNGRSPSHPFAQGLVWKRDCIRVGGETSYTVKLADSVFRVGQFLPTAKEAWIQQGWNAKSACLM